MSLSIMLAPNYGLEFLYLPFSFSQQKMPELKRWWGGRSSFPTIVDKRMKVSSTMQHIISFIFFLSQHLSCRRPSRRLFLSFLKLASCTADGRKREQMSFKALSVVAAWGFAGMPAGTKSSGRPQQFPIQRGWSPTGSLQTF